MKKLLLLSCFMTFALSSYAQEQEDEETRRIMKMYNQANMALKMNNIDDAISRYEELIRLVPDFPDTYMMLGDAYAKKTNDAAAIEKAIGAYQKYLRLNPQSENAYNVQAAIDELEYLFEAMHKREKQKANLAGRWASNLDDDEACLFILDIQEIGGKIKIDIDPSSLAYSDNFVNKTAYAQLTENDGYFFYFTDDNTYIPSQAGYNLSRGVTNYAIGSFGGNYSGVLGIFGNAIIDAAQEKDIARNTRKIYELELIPDGNKFTGYLHYVHQTASQTGQKVLADSIVVLDFEKVRKNYVNMEPLEFTRFTSDKTIYLKGTEEKYKTLHWKQRGEFMEDSEKAAKKVLKMNPEIYKYYRQGNAKKNWGKTMVFVGGIGTVAGATVLCYGAFKPVSHREETTLKTAGIISTAAGIGTLFGGIAMINKGNKQRQHAIEIYNESAIKNKRNAISEINFNVNGNGFGLAVTF